ncbi:MAG TPA: damage-inducible protein CinA [Desulfobacteraceae bacterium]|nr:damage-inducible protein CinA [Desulfobacteraceae bacterium]|tara:strand:+ start:357 stop:1091 length:735 start_codon:yes stop_codon:yes gene_type:complete
MKTVETQFTADHLTLRGILHLPETAAPPLVVGSHGLEGSLHSAKQLVLSRLLPAMGIAFFRFDHRGCGSSDGNFVTDTSLDKRTRDYTAAVGHVLGLRLTSDRIALFGSSMGGATCINAWAKLTAAGTPPLGGILCAAPVVSRSIRNIPVEANDNRPALPLRFFAENLLFNLLDKASALHHMMIFHGDADEIVPVSNAHDLYAAMAAPKEKIIHQGGGHQMSDPAHQADFEARAQDWYKKIFGL